SGPDHLMFWDYTGDKVVPNLAKGLEMQDGGKVWLLHLRRGMKWSDGKPYTMFPDVLAGSTVLAGQMFGYRAMGGFAPAHYMKQFHPKYAGQADVDKKAKDAKFDSW